MYLKQQLQVVYALLDGQTFNLNFGLQRKKKVGILNISQKMMFDNHHKVISLYFSVLPNQGGRKQIFYGGATVKTNI